MNLRFVPQTITSQLLTVLVIVLVIAQVANLFILIGEKRLQARANVLNSAMENTVKQILRLPSPLPKRKRFKSPKQSQGHFFLSSRSHASLGQTNNNIARRYENRFKQLLNEHDIQFLTASLALRERSQGLRERKPRHKGDHHRPPRPIDASEKDSAKPKELVISVELEPGRWFNRIESYQSIETLTPRIFWATICLLVLTLLTAWFFIKRITRPLSELTIAAERFGRGDQSWVHEQGPQDIKQAAQAFNTMQKRLSKMLETQRMMLRAVGHDLRTPLTSLKLRSELLSNETERNKFIATIDDMTQMTEEILHWAKNASGLEQKTAVDLSAFLASIVDDFSDQGQNISMQDCAQRVIHIRRAALKRALQNIMTNALKYGKQARVHVEEEKGMIHIHIDDDGPGIDEPLINEALKPFVRLETSRNSDTGGTGLGLSIAETIVLTEGGKLNLCNRQPNGLRVTISLPYNPF